MIWREGLIYYSLVLLLVYPAEPRLPNKVAIGIKDNMIIGGPPDAIRSQTDKFVIIEQGKEKYVNLKKLYFKTKFSAQPRLLIFLIFPIDCQFFLQKNHALIKFFLLLSYLI